VRERHESSSRAIALMMIVAESRGLRKRGEVDSKGEVYVRRLQDVNTNLDTSRSTRGFNSQINSSRTHGWDIEIST